MQTTERSLFFSHWNTRFLEEPILPYLVNISLSFVKDPKLLYRVHKNQTLDTILSHLNPVHILTFYIFKIRLRPGYRGSIPGRDNRIFPLASVSRPALGSTQPPVQWVPGVLSPGLKRGQGATLTTHRPLVPRSWMSRSYTFSPPCSSIGVLWDCFTWASPSHICLSPSWPLPFMFPGYYYS
jgi:hypothetical protein